MEKMFNGQNLQLITVFIYDIDHAANKNPAVSPKMISDVRAPLYFTVPGGSAE